MKKKYKLKKSAIIIIFLFIITIISLSYLIISLFQKHSYSIEYNIDNFAISENYDNKEKLYYYEISYKDTDYNFIYESKKIKSEKLISNIKTIEEDKYTCLIIESKEINSKPLCSEEKKLIDLNLLPASLKDKLQDYIKVQEPFKKELQNYKLYTKDNKILIWSYKGFNYIENEELTFIPLFSKDIYDIPHATKINNYIVIPNYEQTYSFHEVFIINLENKEIEKWPLDHEISFDSYILGTNDKSLYIVDNKNKIEYELVPHKKKMRILATSKKLGLIYKNGTEEKISMNKLTSDTIKFSYPNNYHYILEDNNLYLSYLDNHLKTKITNNKVTKIIYIENDEIYYLVNDTLYKYNLEYGETKLISYSEWEFNNHNLIFINS